MCGVAGLYAYGAHAQPADPQELARLSEQMRARGPDGAGTWYSPDRRAALVHRRLSIIDLSDRGAQPMSSADGRLTISFNGEIYNYRPLRAQLEARGRIFRSDSDTEVLLHLYAEKGEGMLHELRGMFAFALWDARRQGLLLARDGFGIKPLYYAQAAGTLRFASQVKALLAGGAVSAEVDHAGIAGFYLFGSIPEPFTLYRAIRALPAGHALWADQTGVGRPQPWFSLAETLKHRQPAGSTTAQALQAAVSAHLIADVPVGAFLSAGIDSTALVGLMRDAGQQEIRTVTLGFEAFRGGPDDEAPLAERAAKHYGTRHVTRYLAKDEFQRDLPQILKAMDQPTIDGLNTWLVSQATAEQGLKVALSGLGGDELFGGYPAFRDIPRWAGLFSKIPAPLGRAGRQLGAWLQALPGIEINPKLLALPEYARDYPGAWLVRRGLFMPWELPRLMGAEPARDGLARLDPLKLIADAMTPDPERPFDRVAALESGLYMRNQLLRDTDWASMAHSLEVRVPLVDSMLLAQVRPQQAGKQPLAQAPSRPLPPEIANRAKTGFRTPIHQWMDEGAAGPRENGHWARQWAVEVLRRGFPEASAQ